MYLKEKVSVREKHLVDVRNMKLKAFNEITVRLKQCDRCPLNPFHDDEIESKIDLPHDILCGKCTNYKGLRKIGDTVWERDSNIEVLIAKGKDMSYQDVAYLLKEGVTKKRIQNTLGFNNVKQLNRFLDKGINPNTNNESIPVR